MTIRCFQNPCLGQQYPGRDEKAWKRHQISHHAERVEQLAGVDWHSRAIAEVKRLAATGVEWCMWQVFQVVGDPPNHKTANGAFASEVEHLGLAHVNRYGKSQRPGSNSSACAYWLGGPSNEQRKTA